MIPGAFDYHRPSTIDEAVKLLADLGDEARVLAGGHSLIPMMKLRMALPENLIDLQDIAVCLWSGSGARATRPIASWPKARTCASRSAGRGSAMSSGRLG